MSQLTVNNHYRTMTREEVADELRRLAGELEAAARVPYASGEVAVPAHIDREFQVDASDDGAACRFEYRLKWMLHMISDLAPGPEKQ
ncbi:MAG TPA: hypothetical protein VMB04_15375 [Mycobacterium sp.]|nr:hypothetical protein [Mycobacterium sp.]